MARYSTFRLPFCPCVRGHQRPVGVVSLHKCQESWARIGEKRETGWCMNSIELLTRCRGRSGVPKSGGTGRSLHGTEQKETYRSSYIVVFDPSFPLLCFVVKRSSDDGRTPGLCEPAHINFWRWVGGQVLSAAREIRAGALELWRKLETVVCDA